MAELEGESLQIVNGEMCLIQQNMVMRRLWRALKAVVRHHVEVHVLGTGRVVDLVGHFTVDNQADWNVAEPAFTLGFCEACARPLLHNFVNEFGVDAEINEGLLQVLNLRNGEGVELRVGDAVAVEKDTCKTDFVVLLPYTVERFHDLANLLEPLLTSFLHQDLHTLNVWSRMASAAPLSTRHGCPEGGGPDGRAARGPQCETW
mmetsp:Transcript_2415/g.6619  ORF Transcript_2415/g.6619 Transcript_2415/m.6619 type:complete len:204 (+) Transcript_2415:848-1459(+)